MGGVEPPPEITDIYVSPTGTGNGEQATPTSFYDALAGADSGDIIHMATGVYEMEAINVTGITIQNG